ncbi:PAS and ANTAR domain-containing protein [Cellulosimicrobium sp. Marseille-Q4280]|uniref:PAS and ANTAR domain-containing protein n=1 Tax=Cellulosimicrobium sp. Marseille-Q4280 TaxID=2937992 RepID=UPI00203C3082|nr:PAS and ANTAR domain-containing protein [Cellulosimicrobium sp. Marseille-Q4280]
MDAVQPFDDPQLAITSQGHLVTVLAALVAGEPQPVGRFRVDLATDRWWWSDEVFAMHGFAPGEVVPTTSLLVSHTHPDDRDRGVRALALAARSGHAFGSMHRIVDASGATRILAVAAQGRRNRTSGQVAEIAGYFVDVTEHHQESARREATAAIRAADASRSVIEQAKGVLMVAFGVDSDEAFELLRKRSNDANVAVRELARRLVGGLGTSGDVVEAARERVDALLTDAERRPAAGAAGEADLEGSGS